MHVVFLGVKIKANETLFLQPHSQHSISFADK